MMLEDERLDTSRPELCPCLRWKGMFIPVEHDLNAMPISDGFFWCAYTQTCIGPDGQLADPASCSSPARACYGVGQV
jgi:hypothetical protein